MAKDKLRGRAATEGLIEGDFALSVGHSRRPAPDGWAWTTLVSVARLESGHTPSRKRPEYWGGDIPWIGIRDATANHGRTLSDTEQHTNPLGISKSAARVLPTNTVCLSRTASVGYVVVMGQPMATSQDFANWVCGENLDHRFLKYVLLAERNAFSRFAHGSTHQTIYYPELKALHICLPGLDEQDRIAGVLSALDDKIELNRRMSQTLEEMARALFRSWFVDFDPVHAKAAGLAPAHMNAATAALFPDRFGEDGLPEGWCQSCLTHFAMVNPKEALRKKTVAHYLDMKSLPTRGARGDAPILREFTSGTKFRNGDVLLARITPCLENGKTALVDSLPDGAVGWGSTEFIVMRGQNGASSGFIYCLSRLDEFRDHAIQSMVGSSGRQRVQQDRLENYLIAIPPIEILDAFAILTDPMFRALSANGNQSETLASLRDSLLPKLMSGEIRVRDAERAVAEVA